MGDAQAVVNFEDLKPVDGLVGPRRLVTEEYREYIFADGRVYRIENPVGLYYREGGGTHRVVGRDGVTHCVTFGVHHPSVVLRWKNRDLSEPVNW